jgi:drug/metabolite transporter (DMT)-like permease
MLVASMGADTQAERRGGDRATLAAFAVGSVLAGGNAVGVRFSNRELPPLWGAGLRFAAAAVLLVVVMAALRVAVPRGRALAGAIVFGALNFFGAFALAYYALIRLHAGFGQIILALVPLATLLLAVAWRLERLRLAAVGGALLSLGGVAVMSGPSLREGIPLVAVLASLGSAVCFAQAAVVVRRFPPVHPVAMNAVAMAAGAGLLLAGSAIAGETWTLPTRTSTWTALAYLVGVGSVVVFLLYLFVLGRWAASRAAYTFVIIPVVTVALSAWLDEEPIGLALVVGGVMVLTGVYVGALRPGTGSAAH